jgi:hypothetical protein
MWVVYFFVSYLALALAIPLGWSLIPLWRKARQVRQLSCPDAADFATVRLDPWYAVKMHAAGNREFRVLHCSQWPERSACAQACLMQMGSRN